MARKRKNEVALGSGIVVDSTSIAILLKDVSERPLITAQEEIALAIRIKAGDREALHTLIEANLRFVITVAKQYQRLGMPLQDLIAEGIFGLIKAAERFDETRGFKFISYAVWWIKQSIKMALDSKSRLVRIPMNRSADIAKISKAREKLMAELHRMPSDAELIEAVELKADDVKAAHFGVSPFSSFSSNEKLGGTSAYYSDTTTFEDRIESEDLYSPDYRVSHEYDLRRVLKGLSEREKGIIIRYLGLETYPETLETIGDSMGLTRERVRQIKDRALLKLRNGPHAKAIKEQLSL